MATTTKATELSQLSSALQVDESTGEIIFTGSLSVDSNTLFVDGDANRVGIGTLTPGSALDVSGDVTVSGTVDGRNVSSDGSKLDTIESNADVTDTANVTSAGALMDSELTNESAVKNIDQELTTTSSVNFGGLDVDSGTLFVDSDNGRVGIGTDSPGRSLDVLSTSSNTAEIKSTGSYNRVNFTTDNDDGFQLLTYDSVNYTAGTSYGLGSGGSFFRSTGKLAIVSTGGELLFVANGSEAARIDSSGNVGIGTSSPDEVLDVNGTANATNLTRDGSQVYSRDNILGTVSESGGVPTGAIIERGSNSNGQFVKYADGTMICSLADYDQVYGDFDSSGKMTKDINFPSVFFDKDSTFITVSLGVTGSGSDIDDFSSFPHITSTGSTQSASGFRYAIFSDIGSAGAGTFVCYIAFGRWY